jgi:Fe-S cluster assembly ATPase SufC
MITGAEKGRFSGGKAVKNGLFQLSIFDPQIKILLGLG